MPKTSKSPFIVTGKHPIRLADYDPADMAGFKNNGEAKAVFLKWAATIAELQDMQFAQRQYALLVTADGRDTAGKSTLFKHLFGDINVNGSSVVSFKAPSPKELLGDFMRRYIRELPDRGCIKGFDRSHFEEVTTVAVHSEYLKKQNLPGRLSAKRVFARRFEDIRNLEDYWHHNGIPICSFYLNLSEGEQKKRLEKRLRDPAKNYKYSGQDIVERKFFAEHQEAAERAINHLSTPLTPRIILPADNKWVARALAARYVAQRMLDLNLHYPVMGKSEQRKQLKLVSAS